MVQLWEITSPGLADNPAQMTLAFVRSFETPAQGRRYLRSDVFLKSLEGDAPRQFVLLPLKQVFVTRARQPATPLDLIFADEQLSSRSTGPSA